MNNLVIREKYKNLLGEQKVYFNTFAKFCLRNIGSITESRQYVAQKIFERIFILGVRPKKTGQASPYL